MPQGGVRVVGLTKAVRGLQEMGLEVDDLKDAFGALATEAAEVVAEETPKRSGRLASSARGNRAKSKAVVRIGTAAVPYAGVINYGWPKRNIAANDYVGRADARITPVAARRLEEEIEIQYRKKGLR